MGPLMCAAIFGGFMVAIFGGLAAAHWTFRDARRRMSAGERARHDEWLEEV